MGVPVRKGAEDMSGHQTHPYLEHLVSPAGVREIWSKLYPIEVLEQLAQDSQYGDKWAAQYPSATDPALRTYCIMSWPADPDKAITIMHDPYYPGKQFVRHAHDFFELAYVYQGRCRTLVDGIPTIIEAGDLCLYDLHAIHSMEQLQAGDVVFNILVRKDLFRRFLLDLLSESGAVSSFFLNSLYNRKSANTCIHLKINGDYRCEALIQGMIELFYRDSPRCQTTLKAQLFLLLMEIARQYEDEHTQAPFSRSGSLNLSDVITHISANYQTATLESTAQHFGYSTRSMTRFLQKHTGRSFREVLQDIQFSHARTMLQNPTVSIDMIASAIGYRDRGNFEKAFKRHCHITPAAYRKQFRTE